ncbi:hypothetical protein ACWATR_09615 [Nostoc sp. UIC 10890]
MLGFKPRPLWAINIFWGKVQAPPASGVAFSSFCLLPSIDFRLAVLVLVVFDVTTEIPVEFLYYDGVTEA